MAPSRVPGVASGDLGQVVLPAWVPAGCLGSCWQGVRGRISEIGSWRFPEEMQFLLLIQIPCWRNEGKAAQRLFWGCGAALGTPKEEFIRSCGKSTLDYLFKLFLFLIFILFEMWDSCWIWSCLIVWATTVITGQVPRSLLALKAYSSYVII